MKDHQLDMLRRIAELEAEYGACDKIVLDERVLGALERRELLAEDQRQGGPK
jgi:hypothetical protein